MTHRILFSFFVSTVWLFTNACDNTSKLNVKPKSNNLSPKDTLEITSTVNMFQMFFTVDDQLVVNPYSNDTIDVLIYPKPGFKDVFSKTELIFKMPDDHCSFTKIDNLHYKIFVDKDFTNKTVRFSFRLDPLDNVIQQEVRALNSDSLIRHEYFMHPQTVEIGYWAYNVDDKPQIVKKTIEECLIKE